MGPYSLVASRNQGPAAGWAVDQAGAARDRHRPSMSRWRGAMGRNLLTDRSRRGAARHLGVRSTKRETLIRRGRPGDGLPAGPGLRVRQAWVAFRRPARLYN